MVVRVSFKKTRAFYEFIVLIAKLLDKRARKAKASLYGWQLP